MRDDIALAAQCGVDGVVLGSLTADGDVDVERTREMAKLARPMEVTFHRAIDMARDIEIALEDIIRTGADRILTSGGEPSAMQGGTASASSCEHQTDESVMAGGWGTRR